MDPEKRISRDISLAWSGVKGFTLLELLLAISILAVVLAMATGGLSLGYRAWSKGGERMERLDRLRVVTSVIGQEVASAFAFAKGSKMAKEVAFVGGQGSLSLVATNPPTGTKEIVLYVDNDPATAESGLILKQDIVPNGSLFSSDKGRVVELGKEITGLRLRYYHERKLSDGTVVKEWLTSWPPESTAGETEQAGSKLSLPKAIEIALVQGNGRGKLGQPLVYPAEVIIIRQELELSQPRQKQ
ncbi:MAG: prepilin-type N-terminal cleavage/methylation domain-containing protein [Thermodesulfobacteriota bacterium]